MVRVIAPIVFLLGLVALPAWAGEEVVPVDVGMGPHALWLNGPLGRDQWVHGGLRVNLEAVLSNELIRKNINAVPPQYRSRALQMQEVRYSPYIWIPDSLIVSPKVAQTGMYGITWRPVGLALALARRQTNVDLKAGIILTYAYIHASNPALPFKTMHFLRPGVDVVLEWEIPVVSDRFLVSLGWASQVYVPQTLGGSILDMGAFDDGSLWHMGGPFLTLHFRFDRLVQF